MKTFTLIVMMAVLLPARAADFQYLQGLRNTDYQLVESETLGRGMHIYVARPDGYEPSQRYPVVFLLDGGNLFPMLASYQHALVFAEESPNVLLVGVSYGASTFKEGNMRSTDFTAPSAERDYWGGAQAFQKFFADELIPMIETRYSVDSTRRVIFGQSLGGQFVLYTAQTRPALFWGHIASNPALHRNLDFFLKTVPDDATRSRVFVASATNDAEQFRVPALRWIEHWTSKDPLPWSLKTVDVPGHSHMSLPPASYRLGMLYLFSDN